MLKEKTQDLEFLKKLKESNRPEDFEGDLQSIPNAYAVDVKESVEYIIERNKQREEDKELEDLLTMRYKIVRLYPRDTIGQNYIKNFKRI
jgi:hypothetical protein